MDKPEVAVRKAQVEIAKILRDLELSTGSVVKSLSTESVDVTTMEDEAPQLQMVVRIELERLPGHRW